MRYAIAMLVLAGGGAVGLAETPESVLRGIGVSPTVESVRSFLEDVARGKHGPPPAADTDAIIAQLGNDNFTTRELATNTLSAMLFPPVAKIIEASKQQDAEVSRRARQVLERISTRGDPIAALFQTTRSENIPVTVSQIVPLLTRCETPAGISAAQDALVAVIGEGDLKQVQEWIDEKDTRLKVAGIRSLGVIRKGKAVGELEKHLHGKDAACRIAAARALLDLGPALDYRKYASELDPESKVLILGMAEKRLRVANKDKRNDADAMGEYQKVLDDYAEALTAVKGFTKEKKPAANEVHWIEIGLDTSKHPEVLMYRVRWFSGTWSCWLVPGFNDREVGKGRDIRLWACFNDHEHEIITTTDKAKQREVLDLP